MATGRRLVQWCTASDRVPFRRAAPAPRTLPAYLVSHQASAVCPPSLRLPSLVSRVGVRRRHRSDEQRRLRWCGPASKIAVSDESVSSSSERRCSRPPAGPSGSCRPCLTSRGGHVRMRSPDGSTVADGESRGGRSCSTVGHPPGAATPRGVRSRSGCGWRDDPPDVRGRKGNSGSCRGSRPSRSIPPRRTRSTSLACVGVGQPGTCRRSAIPAESARRGVIATVAIVLATDLVSRLPSGGWRPCGGEAQTPLDSPRQSGLNEAGTRDWGSPARTLVFRRR